MKKRFAIVLVLAGAFAASAAGQTPVAKPKNPAPPASPQMMDRMPPPAVAPMPAVPPAPPVPPGLPRIPRAWWKNSEMAKELNLTDQQVAKLEQTFTENRLKLIDLRASVEKEETKLQPLIEADRIDENQISSQLDALIAARGRLEKANAMMGLDMRKVLTQEQWKKLQSMQGQMRGPGRLDRDRPMGRHAGRRPGYPGKTPEPPVGPNGPDGKGRPTEEQPR